MISPKYVLNGMNKTHYILFGQNCKLSIVDTFTVICNNYIIPCQNKVKYLSLTLIFCLVEIIINNIIRKCNSGL